MAEARDPVIQERIDTLERQYVARFAGRSRLTRDLTAIAALIEGAEGLVADASGSDADSRTAATDLLAFYRAEREEIVAAKEKAGPDGLEASLLGLQANTVIHRYRRHFAGKSRDTRDVFLLDEMLEELRTIHQRMVALQTRAGIESLAHDRDVVENYLDLFTKEHAAILPARKSGSMTDQAMRFGAIANEQFAVYRACFAGRSRATRDPALLERVLQALKAVEEGMDGLRNAGFQAEFNDKNLGNVRGQRDAYHQELAEIRTARKALSIEDLTGHLGAAANAITDEYRESFAGQDRTGVSLEKMGALTDRIGMIERQMRALDQTTPVAANVRNLALVRDTLTLYESEFDAILEAQAAGK